MQRELAMHHRLLRAASVLGPGLVVMLADTDAGSVITVAQSGAQWGYRMLALQLLVIPLMFVAQELTVRLALCSGRGFGELVLERYGRTLAWISMATLVLSCFGALITEISGLAGAGQLFGVPVWASALAVCTAIFAMVATGSYASVERIALGLGAFELAFLVVAWAAHPNWSTIGRQMLQQPLGHRDYLYLVAANLGTSIMPWTLFYQQSALIDKGMGPGDLRAARMDTLAGAVLCQLITVAVLVASAAAFGGDARALDSVPQIAEAFTPALGPLVGHVVFAMALVGGALVATIVVSLSAAWALGEIRGVRHSLAAHPREAPWFYASFGLLLAGAGAVVASGVNLVRLSIATGVLNALLLPVVLGLLYWLARTALPERSRLRGSYALAVGAALAATSALALFSGIGGIIG